MRLAKGQVKLVCVIAFSIMGLVLLMDNGNVTRRADAFSDGPPPGFTGAPGEQTCTSCHSGPTEGGTFEITRPQNYIPGQTYQITVRLVNSDTSRDRWGFQLTALAGTTMAGTFTNLGGGLTQVVGGVGRDYIEHTTAGTFAGQTGSAEWTFNWTAPSTDMGPVTFYSAGNQSDGNGSASGDRIITASAQSAPVRTPFDFDGDHKTDIGIFRPAAGEWWINRSSTGVTFALQFGASTDKIAAADYTGDGKSDIAVWRPSDGNWYVLRSEDNSFFAFPFGVTGDIPAPADYDADGKADAAVFRPSSATWFITQSSGAPTQIFQFGVTGDLPVVADYDGDGKADVGIFRPTGTNNAEWWIQRSTAGLLAMQFGANSDRTVQGDYTGDGKTDIAIWKESTGQWFIVRSEDFSFFAFPFGQTADLPAPGDYDGDGKTDPTVFRPASGTWFIARSTAGTQIVQFGATGDKPIPNAFVR